MLNISYDEFCMNKTTMGL